MFMDKALVDVKAGNGGNGAISMYREKYIEFGGPDGGHGGRGGSIIFVASTNVSTLLNFRFSRTIRAENGKNGASKNQYGKGAEDVRVEVPVGTVVYDRDTHELIVDLSEEGQEFVIAKGGRGGRGNASFKSSVNRLPRVAENGEYGEKRSLILELKLLADVGLVGLPNAGKSTLLSIISAAKPTIADYPFTTITPNLGVVSVDYNDSFVVADLPGLIEGAASGKGLGLQFLRHLERCRIVVHLVAMDGVSDPYDAYQTIRHEIKSYGYNIINRPEVIVASKMDDDDADVRLAKFKEQLGEDVAVYPISALTNEGIKELIYHVNDLLKVTEAFPLYEQTGEEVSKMKVYDATLSDEPTQFEIIRLDAHTYEIKGEEVVKYYRRFNISTEEGMLRLLQFLRKIGVDDQLDKMELEDGDIVILDNFEFEYFR